MVGEVIFFGSMVKRRRAGRQLVRRIGRNHVPRTRLVYKPRKINGLPLTLTCTHCVDYAGHNTASTYKIYPSYIGFDGLMRPSIRFMFPIIGSKQDSSCVMR